MSNTMFRGMNTQGKWVFGSLVVTTHGLITRPKQRTKTWIVETSFGNGGWFIIYKRQYVKPNSVGQCTGLTDKNSKQIYNGDIVIIDNCLPPEAHRNHPYEIRYKDGVFGFFAFNHSEVLTPIGNFEKYHIEVIGNSYENSDLLKGDK